MAAGKLEIKARIRSVDSTRKITKAMQLVASSKLKKQKQFMEENREYAYYLKETVQEILSSIENSMHPYLQKNDAKKAFTIVFTSDMGLCGGYNANIYRMLQNTVSKDDDIVMIGLRGAGWIHNKGYHVIREELDLEDECYSETGGNCGYGTLIYNRQKKKYLKSVFCTQNLLILYPLSHS